MPLLPKCPRCFSEAQAFEEMMTDLDSGKAREEHWIACTKCEFASDAAPTREDAVKNWKFLPQEEPAALISILDVPSPEETFKECLINVLQDISKSLKTIATKQ